MDEGNREFVNERIDDLPFKPNLTFIRPMYARENLDKRRFAGPILAKERMDLSGVHIEVDVVKRGIRRKAFR